MARIKKPLTKCWRPTVEDERLLRELREKLGVSDPAILRMAIRKFAETIIPNAAVDK